MNSPPEPGGPDAGDRLPNGSFRIASIGSGSSGNGTLVACGDACFLVDCGFPLKETWARLTRHGIAPERLAGILVTHEHSDHASGVVALAHRFRIPVHLSHGTLRSLQNLDPDLARPFNSDASFTVDGVTIQSVTVPHDAREPTQFVFSRDGVRLGVLTDVGHVSRHVAASFQGCTALFMESNHDLGMLMRGDYPPRLKRRIAGDLGHLSNEQAADFLARVLHDGLTHVVVGHVSEQNNARRHLDAAFGPFAERLTELRFATQGEGVGWLEVGRGRPDRATPPGPSRTG